MKTSEPRKTDPGPARRTEAPPPPAADPERAGTKLPEDMREHARVLRASAAQLQEKAALQLKQAARLEEVAAEFETGF